MKKKMSLKDLSVKSFTTNLEKEKLQTAKGGDFITDLCVSGPFEMCFSHFLMTCDCTRDPRGSECCGSNP